MGVAIFDGYTLTDYYLKRFKGAWSEKKLSTILQFLTSILPDSDVLIAIKIPDELPVSKSYIQLVGAINVHFERMLVQPEYSTLSEIKLRCTGQKCISKAVLFEAMANRYPELMPEYAKHCRKKLLCYEKLFEAVALGHVYSGKETCRVRQNCE